MPSLEARTSPPPARPGPPAPGASRQLALPLPPLGAAPPPPALACLAGGAPVRPRQVWVRLPPPVRAEVRRAVWRVLEEVLRDEPRQ